MKVNPTDDLGFSEKSHAKHHTPFSIAAYIFGALVVWAMTIAVKMTD
jgi:hypothetical protein